MESTCSAPQFTTTFVPDGRVVVEGGKRYRIDGIWLLDYGPKLGKTTVRSRTCLDQPADMARLSRILASAGWRLAEEQSQKMKRGREGEVCELR